MNIDIPTVSTASIFDTARCLVELNAIEESVILKYLPELGQLLKAGWQESLVESRWVESDLIQLWQLASTERYSHVGVDVAIHQEMKNYGVLAKWVGQCDNLKEAFLLFIENIQLLNTSECWEVSETKSEYRIECSFSNNVNYPNAAVHRSMMSLLIWARALSGKPFNAKEISWPNVDTKIKQSLVDYADKVTQSVDTHSVVLKKEVLDYKIQTADPYLKRVLAQQAIQLKGKPCVKLADKVVYLFQQDIHRYRNIDQVSRQLNLSQSTLYRRLKQEGTQFSTLLDEYRQIHYQHLKGAESVSERISEALGFGDVSSYLKAKKRWNRADC